MDKVHEKIKIRFHFSLQFIDTERLDGKITNSYKITIDDKTVFEQTLIDTTGGHNPQPEPYFEITGGEHEIRVMLKETGKSAMIRKYFEKDTCFSVSYDGWDKKQVIMTEFPINRSFFIE
jgi:hypothetical protein